jgi:hypothetical protein
VRSVQSSIDDARNAERFFFANVANTFIERRNCRSSNAKQRDILVTNIETTDARD